MAEVIRENPALSDLNLSHNNIGNKGRSPPSAPTPTRPHPHPYPD